MSDKHLERSRRLPTKILVVRLTVGYIAIMLISIIIGGLYEFSKAQHDPAGVRPAPQLKAAK